MIWENRFFKFLAILVPVIILAIIAIKPIDAMRTGKEIKLKGKIYERTMEMNDMYGYVQYDIEKVSLEAFKAEDLKKFNYKEFPYGQRVYIYLKENEKGISEVERVRFEKEEGPCITGNINYFDFTELAQKQQQQMMEELKGEFKFDYEDIKNINIGYNLKNDINEKREFSGTDVLVNFKMKYDYAIYESIEEYKE